MALRGEPLPVYEDGSIIRDFVYVDDVVDALWATLASPPVTGRVTRRRFRLHTTILDVAASWQIGPGRLIPSSPGRSATAMSGPHRATSRRTRQNWTTSPDGIWRTDSMP